MEANYFVLVLLFLTVVLRNFPEEEFDARYVAGKNDYA